MHSIPDRWVVKTMMTTKDTAIVWMILILGAQLRTEPVIKPGPSSGIMMQDAPGFLLTERKILSQKIFVSLDPRISIEKSYNISHFQLVEMQEWYIAHVNRAQMRVQDILEHARKPFINQSISKHERPKRFIGFLIASIVFATLGMVVSTTTSAVNSISIKTLQAEVGDLRENIEYLYQEIEAQKANMEQLIKVVNNIIVTTNLHSELISRSTDLHKSHKQFKDELLFLRDPIMFHTLMFLDEVQNGINDLLHGRVPLYFVSRDMVKKILSELGEAALEEFHINLSFEMGSALPLYIDSERMEICFLLSIPYMDNRNIFQMKYIHNVGTYQDNFHIRIQTPGMITYQLSEPEVFSVPILSECVKFKDNNFQCEGRPFVYDASQALCGLDYVKYGSEKCMVTISKTHDNTSVQAILIVNKWLVSTMEKEANVYYKELIQNKKILLPTPVVIVQVPKDTKVVIGDITLYPVGNDVWESEILIVDAFQGRDPDLKFLLDNKPNHTIELLVKKDNLTINTLRYSLRDKKLLSLNVGTNISEIVTYLLIIGCILWLIFLSKKLHLLNSQVDNNIPLSIWMKRENHSSK